MNKPYAQMLNRIQEDAMITPGNTKSLTDFLTFETPSSSLLTKWKNPPVIQYGNRNKLIDVDGKEYIDCMSGMSSMNLGHADPRIAEVLKEQYMKLGHWFDYPTPERLKLVRRLCDITPGQFKKRVWLGLSGADAVDSMLRAVRSYTKRTQIISFYGAYHGQTIGTMGLSTKAAMHTWYNPVPPADHGINRFPFPYSYRCSYEKESSEESAKASVLAIDRILCSGENTMANYAVGLNNVAAIVVEPIQCSSGYLIPHGDFLIELRKLADKHGMLLVFDEIQSGMGRTGKMWACEHSGVVPDILLVGKSLGCGVPMSAVVARSEIFEDFAPGMSSSTYAGYALGCAVANKVIDIYEEDHVVEHCANVGAYLGGLIQKYAEKHPLVGTYDHAGLALGVEFVKNRKTKEPALDETIELCDLLLEKGVIAVRNGYYGNRISFIPPVNIIKDDVDQILQILDNATSEIEKKFKYN